MRTIALASAKGGSGKTTLAIALGIAAMEDGERPYMIDLDPQGSLRNWHGRRRQDDPPVDRIDAARLGAAIAGLPGHGFTLAIIDTVGIETAATTEAMRAADLTLVPCRPSTLDLEAARPTLTALMRIGASYALVLNACPPGRSARLEDASRALSILGVLASPPIVQRADHMDAVGSGLGPTELDPAGKAAAEARELWRWIKRRTSHGEAEKAVA
jgi:chromosome partitioning protein